MKRTAYLCILAASVLLCVLLVQARAGAPERTFPVLSRAWEWPGECVECIEYVVGMGDTLWSIAGRYYPERRTDEVVWAIRRANGLEGREGPLIRPGQKLWIPDPELYGIACGK